jgi:hypothetical protein
MKEELRSVNEPQLIIRRSELTTGDVTVENTHKAEIHTSIITV